MNRREFSALLPMLAAAPIAVSGQSTPVALKNLESGEYPQTGATSSATTGRTGAHFLLGMLPDNIRLEAHTTTLAPGAPPEPINHHKHTEIWFVREGEVSLMTKGVTRTLKAGEMGLCVAGDEHTVGNASKTASCTYFVATVGPPE
jgi:quercetin dioxygenase-like cupin family protein